MSIRQRISLKGFDEDDADSYARCADIPVLQFYLETERIRRVTIESECSKRSMIILFHRPPKDCWDRGNVSSQSWTCYVDLQRSGLLHDTDVDSLSPLPCNIGLCGG